VAQDTAMSMNLSALLTQMDTPAQAHQMFRQPGAHLRPVSRGCASRLRPFLLISFSSLVAVCRRSEIDGGSVGRRVLLQSQAAQPGWCSSRPRLYPAPTCAGAGPRALTSGWLGAKQGSEGCGALPTASTIAGGMLSSSCSSTTTLSSCERCSAVCSWYA
jgi:hypothetical protein